MKVSIITICYNEPDIEKTCESIASQTYQDFQWVVIDGGSDNETIDVLNKYKNKINIFVSEEDNGVYHAMNKGIGLAGGEYLHFLNAGDCYFDKNSLQNIVKDLVSSDIVFGDLKFFQGDKSFVKEYPDEIPYGWLESDSLPHPASFIKKELFKKYGLYNEKNRVVSDWEKWIEFVDVHKCTYKHVPTVVAIHNYNGISSVYDELHLGEIAKIKAKYYGSIRVGFRLKKIKKALKTRLMKIFKYFN